MGGLKFNQSFLIHSHLVDHTITKIKGVIGLQTSDADSVFGFYIDKGGTVY